MAARLSIKNVPEEILDRLRARAERNGRSLQEEILAIVEAAAVEGNSLGTGVDELVTRACQEPSAYRHPETT